MKLLYKISICLILVVLGTYTSEFVKKPTARVNRKQAQQRDTLIEKCATVLDALLVDSASIIQSCSCCVAEWYSLLKSLATTDSCCLETASIDALKAYVASLHEVVTAQQKLKQAMKVCQEKRLAFNVCK